MIDVFLYFLIKFICILFDGNFSELSILKIDFKLLYSDSLEMFDDSLPQEPNVLLRSENEVVCYIILILPI